MPGMSDESKQDFRDLMKEDHKELASDIVQGFTEALKSLPQPAAPAQQVTDPPTECPNCKVLQGKVESWEKGEQFLAFNPELHGKHPDSKPRVDAYVAEAIKNQTDDDLKAAIIDRGFLPPVKEITLPSGTKIKAGE